MKKLLKATASLIFAVIALILSNQPIFAANYNYFGDGSDGDVTISTNTSLTVPNKNGSYDGDMVVKNYSSLTVNEGVTLTTDQPGRGLLIYVSGDLTVNGTISMTARGAYANPTTAGASDNSAVSSTGLRLPMLKSGSTDTLSAADFAGTGNDAVSAVSNQTGVSGDGKIYVVERTGGAGGVKSGKGPGVAGSSKTNSTGGGGSGGSDSCTLSPGVGTAGTCFSGGTGGGGVSCFSKVGNENGITYGGRGGYGMNGYWKNPNGGGAGNPGGSGYNANYSAQNGGGGTGGILFIVVGGNVNIGSNGSIQANGMDGGDASSGYQGRSSGGGASGGGIVWLLHAGSITNNGSVTANGGTRGIAGGGSIKDGGNGGAGTTVIEQVDSGPQSCQPLFSDTSHTIVDDCSFNNVHSTSGDPNTYVIGMDPGTGNTNTSTLTIDGGVLAVLSNQKMAVGSIEITSGSIVINEGAEITPGGIIYYADADGDSYPASTSPTTIAFSAPANSTRRSELTSIDTADCDDSDYSIDTPQAWYADSDGDNYGNSAVTTSACFAPSGYVADNTDCYDSNSNAHPGSTHCDDSVMNRGDGSSDYNCDGAETSCQGDVYQGLM